MKIKSLIRIMFNNGLLDYPSASWMVLEDRAWYLQEYI